MQEEQQFWFTNSLMENICTTLFVNVLLKSQSSHFRGLLNLRRICSSAQLVAMLRKATCSSNWEKGVMSTSTTQKQIHMPTTSKALLQRALPFSLWSICCHGIWASYDSHHFQAAMICTSIALRYVRTSLRSIPCPSKSFAFLALILRHLLSSWVPYL